MTYRIGVDVGGTFTDYVASGGARMLKGKVPSRPRDEARSVVEALEEIARAEALKLPQLMAATNSIVLGTTVVLNTMLEFDGALTGLITNEGFRDVIELRRGFKESQFDLSLPAPPPIVLRRHRRTVPGRIDAQGREIVPLDEDAVAREIEYLRAAGVEAIAVCFLHSYVRPEHERRVGEMIRELFPECFVSLSSDVLPQIREFERISTTLVNAYASPRLRRYLEDLHTKLGEIGFEGSLLIMQSNGGVMDVDFSRERGVEAVFSGPAGGVVAALRVASESGYRSIITADMGGTSYDVCLVHEGEPQLGVDQWVNRYRVAVPLLDIHTIGAGGGSIAWVDRGSALQVGPESAGAYPGPACYGRGGTRPTVTDANLVLGYIDRDRFLGGKMQLDLDAAERAIDEHVARPLSLSTLDAAVAIFRIANSEMSNALRAVSVARGRDPRDYALVAFGGAAAIHAGVQARDLGISTVLMPRNASVLSAYGAHVADYKVARVRSLIRAWDDVDLDELNATFAAMQIEAEQHLGAATGGGETTVLRRFVDARYEGQVQEVIVPIRSRTRRISGVSFSRALSDFHALHETLYGFKRREHPVQIISARIEMSIARPPLAVVRHPFGDESSEHALVGSRRAFADGRGFVEMSVYDGARLVAGNVVTGPAIIHEPDTTLVVGAGQEAMLDQNDVYVVEFS